MIHILSENPFIAVTDKYAGQWIIPDFRDIGLHSSYLQAYNYLAFDQYLRESYSAFDYQRQYYNLQTQIYEAIKNDFYYQEPLPQYEVLELTEYPIGGCFREHHDYSPYLEFPRIATAILYVNDDFESGETHFKNLGVKVKPKAGRLLYFRYDDPTTAFFTSHEGLPVFKGVKRIVSQWISTVPLPF